MFSVHKFQPKDLPAQLRRLRRGRRSLLDSELAIEQQRVT